MNEDKETNIVNQVPSWHFTVCLKCNKYLSTYTINPFDTTGTIGSPIVARSLCPTGNYSQLIFCVGSQL